MSSPGERLADYLDKHGEEYYERLVLRNELLLDLLGKLELSRQDVVNMAREKGATAVDLEGLNELELYRVYKEAVGLDNEGLLYSYAYHLSTKEGQHEN